MKKKINSKRKGAAGEREWAQFLREYGYVEARRTQQYCGLAGDADVACQIFPKHIADCHWEVKRVERLNVDNAMEQAVKDCGASIPIVAHRKNHKEWLVTMRGEDFLKVIADLILI